MGVQIRALFFKDGEVVGHDWESEDFIPGIPLSIQLESWDEFDSAEVFVKGYGYSK